jgi:transposase
MFFAGIDVHTRYLVVVLINNRGERVVAPTRIPVSQPDRLLALLAAYRPVDAIMETSSSWPWVYEVLTKAGVHFVLAHARRLRAIADATYKRDDIDAELLARMRFAGLIPEVYASPAAQREWATLLRHRITLVTQRTRLVNRIHAQLHMHGLHLERGALLTRAGRQWLRTVAWPQLSREQRVLVKSHGRIIAQLRPLIRALDRRIAAVAGPIPEAQLLRTIPGIGPNRSLVICAEALPIARFRTPGHLASYAGLVPTSKQSGERPVRHGEIPAAANRWLRGALVRAVVSHVQHAPDSWLTPYYLAQKARLGWPTARVAAARKLARAIHAMLRTKTPWKNAPGAGELERTHAA